MIWSFNQRTTKQFISMWTNLFLNECIYCIYSLLLDAHTIILWSKRFSDLLNANGVTQGSLENFDHIISLPSTYLIRNQQDFYLHFKTTSMAILKAVKMPVFSLLMNKNSKGDRYISLQFILLQTYLRAR